MKRIWLAGAFGAATLLSACGGGNQESTPSESPSATESAAQPAPEATSGASEQASPTAEPSATQAAATPAAASAATSTPTMAAADGPPDAFKVCAVCHSAEPGKNGIGPSLAGVYGTKAGEVPGYDFSDAMKNSGLVWNEATLDKYLANPQAMVPGTKMTFAGFKDEDKREAVIKYLKSIK